MSSALADSLSKSAPSSRLLFQYGAGREVPCSLAHRYTVKQRGVIHIEVGPWQAPVVPLPEPNVAFILAVARGVPESVVPSEAFRKLLRRDTIEEAADNAPLRAVPLDGYRLRGVSINGDGHPPFLKKHSHQGEAARGCSQHF